MLIIKKEYQDQSKQYFQLIFQHICMHDVLKSYKYTFLNQQLIIYLRKKNPQIFEGFNI